MSAFDPVMDFFVSDHARRAAQAATDEQIRALRAEAGQAGDAAQVALCDHALAGDDAARVACANVIREASAAR